MGKLAILKNYSFGIKSSINDVDDSEIQKSLENKLEFRDFSGTLEFLYIVQEIFGKQSGVEITNCDYNKDTLIQSLSVDDENSDVHDFVIFVKREINDNDSYTFFEFDPNNPESDVFKYKDISTENIITIIKKKSIIDGVLIDCNGNIDNEQIMHLNYNDDVGKIYLKKSNKEILYLNISNIVNQHIKEENSIEHAIKEKMNAYCADHIFIQIDIGLCVLNCFYKSFSEIKNETVSKLINQDVYGDTILYIQSKMNDDSETILNINDKLFKNIAHLVSNKGKINRKNPYFFNLYRELDEI